MPEIKNELTQLVWLPLCRRLEPEASWVDKRHDSERHATIGQIDTADTAVVLNEHAKEVVVGDALGVSGGLHASHHKLVLRGDLLLNTLLLFGLSNFVLNLAEIEHHLSGPVSNTSLRAILRPDSLLNQFVAVSVTVVTALDTEHLLYVEANAPDSNLAVVVVDLDLTSADFLGSELVLLKDRLHC